jgi:hypothetical protein
MAISELVTCTISTRNRYFTTLPLTLQAICNQTFKPKYLIIFDDGEHKDLRNDPLYTNIFTLLNINGIEWQVIWGEGKGQVLNYIKSLSIVKTKWIWRIDDDCIPNSDVLETLLYNLTDDVGAVGGLVIEPTKMKHKPTQASNKIEDIYLGLNEQWYIHPNGQIKEVDHLYSSFIYRKDIAEYNTELSVVGHREETMLTYDIKRKGYKVLLNPFAITWHACNPNGGIREGNNQIRHENAMHDEVIFAKKLIEWNVKPYEYSFVVLDNGIGDHYVFKSLLPAYFEKNKGKKHIFFVCYPEVFEDVKNIQLASIEDSKAIFGENNDNLNIYKFMVDHNWRRSLKEAFELMYGIVMPNKVYKKDERTIEKVNGKEKVIISPYSQNASHAKSYPYWQELVALLKQRNSNVYIVQIGKKGELPINGVDEYKWDLPLKIIEQEIDTCKYWISVDNFLPHLVRNMERKVKGVVLWGISDPEIFGYRQNINILKSRTFLRKDQFNTWSGVQRNDQSFEMVENVYKLNNEGK